MAVEKEPYESYEGSPISKGILQYDMWKVKPTNLWDWDILKAKIAKHGIRNSLLIAQMVAFMAQMLGNNVSVDPYASNIYSIVTPSINCLFVKPNLVRDLIKRDLWNKDICSKIFTNGGSIQNIEEIPEDIKLLYKTGSEISYKTIFEMAAARGSFIDHQSQCSNVHIIDPSEKLSSLHFYAWKIGLKSSMYHFVTNNNIKKTK